jgi:hypothetical protein
MRRLSRYSVKSAIVSRCVVTLVMDVLIAADDDVVSADDEHVAQPFAISLATLFLVEEQVRVRPMAEGGQQILRTYKGREYRATATDGYLVRTDNNVNYNWPNQLSRGIHDNAEKARKQLVRRLKWAADRREDGRSSGGVESSCCAGG